MVEDKLFDHTLGLDDHSEYLNVFFPCFEEHIPTVARDMYDFLSTHVVLVGGGMGSPTFRESKANMVELLEINGYCPVMTMIFVESFENKLMSEYLDEQKSKK